MTDDLTTLTDDELDLLARDVIREQERRATMAEAETRLDEITDAYQRATGRQDGDDWAQPTHALDAYRHGAIVAREGRWFRSRHHANVWDPLDAHGQQWWQEIWPNPDEEAGGWVTENPDGDGPKPWNPDTTYYPPVSVTHDGKVWTLAYSNALPGWEPGGAGMHDVWKEMP